MTTEITLSPDARIEFGFGTVKAEKTEWMYGEYFPYMAPAMAEHQLNILAGFRVIATNFAGGTPTTGSIASWPSANHRAALHNDPRFLKIQPARDAAMEFLSGGHLFESIDDLITLNTDADYAFIISADPSISEDNIFALPLTDDSPEQSYAGKFLMLRPWSEASDELLKSNPATAEVFRVRFSPSAR
ncbi:hypothetical protein [Cognatishimia activa]|uniref:hypothetical protein n=1 Tax=Cognatishimia activa TaxID=1715691 RepID=UPI0022322AB4|nr:hypothetical protein [Cognatishimia activa]UZD92428.1 hypothetical protein M0D42_07420 [Cognatishimia activa]